MRLVFTTLDVWTRGDKFDESVFLNLCHARIHTIHHILPSRSDFNEEDTIILELSEHVSYVYRDYCFIWRRISCVSQVSTFEFEVTSGLCTANYMSHIARLYTFQCRHEIIEIRLIHGEFPYVIHLSYNAKISARLSESHLHVTRLQAAHVTVDNKTERREYLSVNESDLRGFSRENRGHVR